MAAVANSSWAVRLGCLISRPVQRILARRRIQAGPIRRAILADDQPCPDRNGSITRGDASMKSAMATLLLIVAAVSPSVAADLKDDLVAMEKRAWTAWGSQDAQAFRDLMTEDAVQAVAGAGVSTGRERIMADVSSDMERPVKGNFLPLIGERCILLWLRGKRTAAD
jgi:hypothetical protein